ncbi:L,D-transpeptidase [Jeongeupia sp. USM3]|uniref:L,D-transpeptidase n=1 Tax=Jeongeupia sp. USM3 TaxID=1906741 RepID=UPI00089DD6F9|nr:L,D-transpeptidase [Jeongeupia sp. USM3]AOX99284.1 hypothetical protein BJP62_01745 [Jeongeupia sp. USM3]
MRISIDIPSQVLTLHDESGSVLRQYPVSTAALGAGERAGSFQTPRGRHVVRALIGGSEPINAVFRARRPTGEVYSAELAVAHPGRDWILSRIIWLSGTVPGFNRLGTVDTMRRYIYIHGTPDSEPMGVPASHGCIRMRNSDVVALFGLLHVGVTVDIVGDPAWVVYPYERDIGAGLVGFGVAGPQSPVSGLAVVGRRLALWRADGCCMGQGCLEPGGTLRLALAPAAAAQAPRLIDALLEEASTLGWRHADLLATAAPQPQWIAISDPVDGPASGAVRRYRRQI